MRVSLELRWSGGCESYPSAFSLHPCIPLFSRAPTVSMQLAFPEESGGPSREWATNPSSLRVAERPWSSVWRREGTYDPNFSNIIWLLSFIVKPPPPRLPLGLGVPGAPSLEPLKSAVQIVWVLGFPHYNPRIQPSQVGTLLTTLVLEFLAPFPTSCHCEFMSDSVIVGFGREQN